MDSGCPEGAARLAKYPAHGSLRPLKILFSKQEAHMRLSICSVLLTGLLCAGSAANAFDLSFTWDGLSPCTNGRPKTVGSPAFVISNLPAGTTEVRFRLVDLDVPGFNHGGGRVGMSTSGQLPPGVFRYKSPCPPNGVHTYEWRAEARGGNRVLGTATARRRYPE